MKIRLKTIWRIVHKSAHWTVQHDGLELAGYLAFLGLLALFPFLIFFTSLTGLFGETQLVTQFTQIVVPLLPQDYIAALKPRMDEILSGPPQGLLTLALMGILWTASSIVEGARMVLNRAYRVRTPPRYIWRRLMSILQFILLVFALMLALFFTVIGPLLWEYFENILKMPGLIDPLWGYLRLFLSALTLLLVVGSSYYVLPNIRQRMRNVLPGAIVVSVLWMLLAFGFRYYLQTISIVNLIYGGLGGFIIALLFFYLLAVVYIFGAEFNYFFERALGKRFSQKVRVSKTKLAEE